MEKYEACGVQTNWPMGPTTCYMYIFATYMTQSLSGLTAPLIHPVANYFLNHEDCLNANGTCPNSNISYYLYTRETQDNPQLLNPFYPQTVRNAQFIKGVPFKVIVHGYSGCKDYSPNMELRPAYFKHGEYNILTVDWGKLAKESCYWSAAHNVATVGRCAAEVLDMIYQTHPDVMLNNTHILGFSLGAHTAALIASNLKAGKIPRLTGFDPALPLFDDWTNSVYSMINPSTATFVDVYHSNMGHKGKRSAGGVVDVYFNNGAYQPGCNCNGSCDHVRAVEYYAESISSPLGLWAFPCWSWSFYNNGFCKFTSPEDFVLVGEPISPEERGVYFAFTNSKSPYFIPPSTYIEDSKLSEKLDVSCSWL